MVILMVYGNNMVIVESCKTWLMRVFIFLDSNSSSRTNKLPNIVEPQLSFLKPEC